MLLAKLFARRDSRSPSRSLDPVKRPAKARRLPRRAPQVESLEDRTLLSGWVVNAVGNLDDPGNDVAVDSAGNIYLAGNFTGTRDFDPGPGTYNLTSVGTEDLFVAKYTSDGNLIWAIRAGQNPPSGWGNRLALDTGGNAFVTGTFTGTVDFGSTTLASVGGTDDIFISKIDPTGGFLWTVSAGGSSGDYGRDIIADSSGNVVAVGSFNGTVDFDPGPGTYSLTSDASYDAFVWKLDTNGNLLSALRVGSTGSESAGGIALDPAGSLLITGGLLGTSDFDPGPGTYNLTSTGVPSSVDAFVLKLSSSGDFIWAGNMGGSYTDRGYGIAVDAAGSVFVTGVFDAAVDFDPGPGVALVDSVRCLGGSYGGNFVVKLDSGGGLLWVSRMLGLNSAQYKGDPIALDGNGDVYVSGSSDSNRAAELWKVNGATGNIAWVRQFSGSALPIRVDANTWLVQIGNDPGGGWAEGRGVAVDSNGNVYATGAFSGTVGFDIGASDVSLTSSSASDVYLVKLTQDYGSIYGRVFNDSNNNGMDDTTELRLKGWTVYLDSNNNGQLDPGEPSSVTGDWGDYQFRHLPAGAYAARQVVQAGWTQTLPAGGVANNVTLATGEFTSKSFGDFNPAQSPAGWERTPSGCKDLRTGLIWATDRTTGSQDDFWFAQDHVLGVVQDGYSDYGLPTLRQMQTAAADGITSVDQSSHSPFDLGVWSTSLVNNQYGWTYSFGTGTATQTPIGPYYRGLIFVRGPGVAHSDDGDANYSDTVTGWTTVTGQGRDGDYRIHASGNGSAKATWTFTAQPAGQYKVLATWVVASSPARNAPYKIFDGSTLLKTTTADQRKAPSSKQGGVSIAWADLGTVTTTGGVIKVELNNNASGNVVADMVRLVPINPTATAALVVTRDTRAAGVDAAIASHYNDDDTEDRLTHRDRLDRHTLRDLLRVRRGR